MWPLLRLEPSCVATQQPQHWSLTFSECLMPALTIILFSMGMIIQDLDSSLRYRIEKVDFVECASTILALWWLIGHFNWRLLIDFVFQFTPSHYHEASSSGLSNDGSEENREETGMIEAGWLVACWQFNFWGRSSWIAIQVEFKRVSTCHSTCNQLDAITWIGLKIRVFRQSQPQK